ncbi:T cell receptor delta variable 3, partial [Lemmus lemmus]
FLFTDKDTLCITLTQSSPDKTVASGSEVTLLCNYDVKFPNPDLFWYRRRQDLTFQFILYRDDTRFLDADFVQGRFSVRHSKVYKTFHLVISPVRPEDSGTYYCASDTTVMQVPRKPVPKPLEHSLGVASFCRKSHIRLSGILLSHLYPSLAFSGAPK